MHSTFHSVPLERQYHRVENGETVVSNLVKIFQVIDAKYLTVCIGL